MRENEDFLLDFYKSRKLTRLLYHFHQYIREEKKRSKKRDSKEKRDKRRILDVKLIHPEPSYTDIQDVLNVQFDPSFKLGPLPSFGGGSSVMNPIQQQQMIQHQQQHFMYMQQLQQQHMQHYQQHQQSHLGQQFLDVLSHQRNLQEQAQLYEQSEALKKAQKEN